MNKEQKLIKAIEISYKNYKDYGARSTKKIIPIHEFFANMLKEIWGKKYDYYYLGDETKEVSVEGKYYPKDIDITVAQDDKPVFCLGVKFVTSNYKQNANNYFENMMGETANIQAAKIPYAQIIIMRYTTPYYTKYAPNAPSKIETISEKDISKYIKLVFDKPQAHRPDEICIFLVNINENTNKVTKTNLKKVFGEEFAELMNKKLSLSNFYEQIENYKKFYELNKIK